MKNEYTELTCIVCQKNTKVQKGRLIPYWFSISTIGCVYSGTQPQLSSPVCSTVCLEKAGGVIKNSIENRSHYDLPKLKKITEIVCDSSGCQKSVTFDILNPVCGPEPLRDWFIVRSGKGENHFCSKNCLSKSKDEGC